MATTKVAAVLQYHYNDQSFTKRQVRDVRVREWQSFQQGPLILYR